MEGSYAGHLEKAAAPMRQPLLIGMPPLSVERNGWPWEPPKEMPLLRASAKADWPRISIITPSYNQGAYIEETIRSVLFQGYPNVEYIIIDGDSSDNTVAVIEAYQEHLMYWVSEPDRGQAHAINKGFAKATGDILAFINSDDFYEPGAFLRIARYFSDADGPVMVAGQCTVFEAGRTKKITQPWWPKSPVHMLMPFGQTVAQPATFWNRALWNLVGPFDEGLHYAFDREFFLRAGLAGITPVLLQEKLCRYRDHDETKTRQTIRFYEESLPIIDRHGRNCGLTPLRIIEMRRALLAEIMYFETFSLWKHKGRVAGLKHFLKLACRYPFSLRQRKVLGLARRLVMFKETDVAELHNV